MTLGLRRVLRLLDGRTSDPREPDALASYCAGLDDGGSFRVVLIGDSRERYLLSRHFARGQLRLERLEFLPRARPADLAEVLGSGDLLLVAMPLNRARALGAPWHVAPRQLSLKSDVARMSARIAAAGPPFGKYARQIRRAGYGFHVAFGREAWRRFFSDFYEPTQRALRGARVKLRQVTEYGAYAEPPEILAITQGGKWVAAAAGYRDGMDYVFVELGFDRGDLSHRQRGAGHALYFAAFARAYCRRVAHLELGMHPPFVLDPVLHYKRQWCPQMMRSPYCERSLAIRLGKEPARGRGLLAQAPLVVEDPDHGLALLTGNEDGAKRHRELSLELGLKVTVCES